MSSHHRNRHWFAASIASATLVVSACAADAPTDPTAAETALPVIFEGAQYSARDFVALGVSPVHFTATPDSMQAGVVYAFTDSDERDRFALADLQQRRPTASFLRTNSKFYDLFNFDVKFLELGPGEAVIDLALHPCHCSNDISSIKASEHALLTKIFDLTNFNTSGDSFAIASGAEIANLSLLIRPDGKSWNNAISSIKVTQ